MLLAPLCVTSVHATEGNIKAGQEKSVVCQGCHGLDGNSLGPTWPNLAGQHIPYIVKQINNFQSGERKDDTMSAMVIGLSQADAVDIASYFSAQKVHAQEIEPDEADLAAGKLIYKGGNQYTGLPACASCHGPNGVGNAPAVFPRVAGQKLEYLIKTISDFRAGTRANDPNEIMRNIVERMTDNEIRAVATYISNMRE
jgi:cytochrome c553